MASAVENLPAVQQSQMTPQRERYAMLKDQAKMFAMSPLIPEHLRKGTPDQTAANCMIAIQMAERMGEMPLVVMQNIHIINGKAGFASQYMIARANASGVFVGRINWRIEGEGDGLEVTAFASLRETGEEVSFTASMRMAKAEGWVSNKKYQSMPEVMLRYRSAAFLVRFYAPDVMLGHQTTEEIEDVVLAGVSVSQPVTAAALLEQAQPDVTEAEVEEVAEGPAQSQQGEQFTANAEEDARVDEFIGFLATKVTVIDVNSLGSDWKDEIASWSEDNRARAAEAQQARVDAIKGGAA